MSSPSFLLRSVPVAVIVASVSAAVILIFVLVYLVFRRVRQKAHRASPPAFGLSSPVPQSTGKTGPVQEHPLFKEKTVLPPNLARAYDADPFADPGSTLEKMPPSAAPLPSQQLDMLVPSIVLPPVPTLDPFADPPALVSVSHDGDGLSRLSAGSVYDEFIARASMSSSRVSSRISSSSSIQVSKLIYFPWQVGYAI